MVAMRKMAKKQSKEQVVTGQAGQVAEGVIEHAAERSAGAKQANEPAVGADQITEQPKTQSTRAASSTKAFHIVLVAPEIPPNTGNVIRLAANTGAQLHLVEPLGFTLDDSKLKRAGLDYHEWARIHVHPDLATALQATGRPTERYFALTTKGARRIDAVQFAPGDAFIFGNETAGLAPELLAQFAPAQRVRLPLLAGQRSLNLSNAVAVTVYEAWRQQGYLGSL